MYAEAHFSHDKLANLPLDNWRTDPEVAPAAGMTGMGIHLTDLMIWLFGSVKKVFATTAKRALQYKTGDVVRLNGFLYICLTDSAGEVPDGSNKWQVLVTGRHHRGEWADNTQYEKMDVVVTTSIH